MSRERALVNNCGKCGKKLEDGDTAYLIKMTRIEIVGSLIREKDIWVLRCEEHA